MFVNKAKNGSDVWVFVFSASGLTVYTVRSAVDV